MEDVERELFGSAPFPVEMVRKVIGHLASERHRYGGHNQQGLGADWRKCTFADCAEACAALDAIKGAE